ncbi:MAG: branched-chain amino acid ABC transporter permease, partial [Gammaproteobacteria bacterium]|nr:branched-chain amino acid ABC transporter permease [Gammaproteobacteria bacterium]
MSRVWIDPENGWLKEDQQRDDVAISEHRAPEETWLETRNYKVPLYKIGRLRYYYKWPVRGEKLWKRIRYWPSRRTPLRWQSSYNPKTLRAESTIVDKRPIWWVMGLALLLIAPLLIPATGNTSLLSTASVFLIYASINLCWSLIIGTAGVFSLASYAVVGAGAFGSAYMSIQFGWPWWSLPLFGTLVGLIFGVLIALPAIRLEGFYYALLTLGVVELCRVYVLQSREFGSATGGLYGADSYLPEGWSEHSSLLLGYYAAFCLLLMALVLFRFINGRRLGRLLRMAPEKREAFAEATGVNYRLARVLVFLIASAALGFIGGFYTAHFRGASTNLFTFDTMLLALSMLVIGGIGRAEGAVIGTLIVVFIDRMLLGWGPARHILIGLMMLGVVLFLQHGLFGIKAQFRAWRDKKKTEKRSERTEKGGDMLPEEATETADKDILFFRRFDKIQREYLKRLVTEEVIEEHRKKPTGQHSEALQRLLNYFRHQPQTEKYALMVVEPFKKYRMVALSGKRGVAPRVVEDRVYTSRA